VANRGRPPACPPPNAARRRGHLATRRAAPRRDYHPARRPRPPECSNSCDSRPGRRAEASHRASLQR
jgi:hypothetical protein